MLGALLSGFHCLASLFFLNEKFPVLLLEVINSVMHKELTRIDCLIAQSNLKFNYRAVLINDHRLIYMYAAKTPIFVLFNTCCITFFSFPSSGCTQNLAYKTI